MEVDRGAVHAEDGLQPALRAGEAPCKPKPVPRPIGFILREPRPSVHLFWITLIPRLGPTKIMRVDADRVLNLLETSSDLDEARDRFSRFLEELRKERYRD